MFQPIRFYRFHPSMGYSSQDSSRAVSIETGHPITLFQNAIPRLLAQVHYTGASEQDISFRPLWPKLKITGMVCFDQTINLILRIHPPSTPIDPILTRPMTYVYNEPWSYTGSSSHVHINDDGINTTANVLLIANLVSIMLRWYAWSHTKLTSLHRRLRKLC